MALGYLIIGMICGMFAGAVALLTEASLLSALLTYAAFGNIGMMGAASFNYIRVLSVSQRRD